MLEYDTGIDTNHEEVIEVGDRARLDCCDMSVLGRPGAGRGHEKLHRKDGGGDRHQDLLGDLKFGNLFFINRFPIPHKSFFS